MTIGEISTLLSVNINTIKSRLNRGKKILRINLKGVGFYE
ncbi:hypothetical protein [Mesobacillus boroniphilus]